MKKFLLINLLFFLISTTLIEAKGSKGIARSIAKTVIKKISTSKLAKKKAVRSIKKNVPKITGVYKFKAFTKKPYIGKSVKTKHQSVQKRLIQHIRSGKLHPNDIKSISYAKVSKKNVSKVEKSLIKKADRRTNGNLENIHHAPKSRIIKKSQTDRKEISDLLKTKF